jgi:dolichol-phosphate mannosyltransferase
LREPQRTIIDLWSQRDYERAAAHGEVPLQFLLKIVRRLLSKEQRRFIKFCLVGASGVPVNLLFTWLGYQYFFISWAENGRKAAAYLLGIVTSIFTNFLLNDLWTWRDREKVQRRVLDRLLRFYLVCSLASGIQFGTAMALSVKLQLHYLLAQLAGIALATFVNFVVNNAWTFRSKNSPPTEEPPPES